MRRKKETRNDLVIPNLKFNSDLFRCPKCGNEEMRRVLGNVSHSPCSRCGNPTMYRVK